MTAFLAALLPSVGVLFIFWIGIKSLIEADRRERAAQARIEAAQRRSANTTGKADSNPRGGPAPAGAQAAPGDQ